jgi:hypothetical protein
MQAHEVPIKAKLADVDCMRAIHFHRQSSLMAARELCAVEDRVPAVDHGARFLKRCAHRDCSYNRTESANVHPDSIRGEESKHQ